MHIGEKIKMVRSLLGLTQDEVAEKIGKTRPLVSGIEKTGKGHPQTIQDICRALKINVRQLEELNENDIKDFISGKSNPDKQMMESLQKENKLLNDLVKSQDEQIRMLKDELAGYKKGTKKR